VLDEAAAERRVVLISSGALSLEVGGPRIFPDSVVGIPNPGWVTTAAEIIAAGDLDGLVAACTPQQFASNGNTAAEVLNVVALMAALGEDGRVPEVVEPLPGPGHAYAAWATDGKA
jgi:protocatechuate 4,5-dioxygenase beta chain